MNIIIDGKQAVLEKDISIEYTCENPLFTDAEGYTLTISFPLASCPENIAIFGHVNRKDIDTEKSVFPCQISCPGFEKSGALAITEISESEVKGQFLEGQSVANYTAAFSPLDTIYVDELDIGNIETIQRPVSPVFEDYYNNNASYIILTWQERDTGVMHNKMKSLSAGNFSWSDTSEDITPFPFLLPLIKAVCEKLSYSYYFYDWETDPILSNLIVCNAFGGQKFLTQSLPHWTVSALFNQLSLFMLGQFVIDDMNKSISFTKISFGKGLISINNILDDFTLEETDSCKYLRSSQLSYSDQDYTSWKYDCCPRLCQTYPLAGEFSIIIKRDTFDDLIEYVKPWGYIRPDEEPSRYIGSLFYAKDIDTYFCMICLSSTEYIRTFSLRPVNRFCPHNPDKDGNTIDLNIFPANVSYFAESRGGSLRTTIVNPREKQGGIITAVFTTVNDKPEPAFSANILEGNEDLESVCFENMPVAIAQSSFCSLYNLPLIDKFVCKYDTLTGGRTGQFNNTLINVANIDFRLKRIESVYPNIDESRKYTFEFISSDFPDVKSIFYIKGKKYLCEKITANITYRGISELKKGTFYRIVD